MYELDIRTGGGGACDTKELEIVCDNCFVWVMFTRSKGKELE